MSSPSAKDEPSPPSAPPDPLNALSSLRSTKSTTRLNQIDRVRASGIGDHISLPQLVVCGDQSAGKSSVLERITGIPFPRQDGVCTKFPTEIILRHNKEEPSITATVIPASGRGEVDKARFRAYRRILGDFEELPGVIAEAAELMQIRGDGVWFGRAFANDVLRIEVVGNTGLHLTVVDLPGLIAVASEEQTEKDVALVGSLVDSYLESSRTIILAVVQASNDIANQGIIQRARKFDKDGQRTVGIITKPDLINKGTEGRIAKLAKNEDTTKLKLGFFLLQNPSPSQIKAGVSREEQVRLEKKFFTSSPWREQALDHSRVGVDALRLYLHGLLDRHIAKELPKVRKEIRIVLAQTEAQLASLGEARPSVEQIRVFLGRLGGEFQRLVNAALDGNYHWTSDDFFTATEGKKTSTRLRAALHVLNGDFASHMRYKGQKRQIRESSDDSSESEDDSDVLRVSQEEYDAWITEVYLRTRGRELPGNYNHALVAELFHEQSSLWSTIAEDHVASVFDLTNHFIEKALNCAIAEETVRNEILEVMQSKLELQKRAADEELQKLVDDERRHPITYNHYYTDNIQKARQEPLRQHLKETLDSAMTADGIRGGHHIPSTELDNGALLAKLEQKIIANMDEQACAEASAGLKAYYKVAMKTFVDNVCRQVIERHIVSGLPDFFSPTTVMELSDEELLRIAAEPEQQKEKRAMLVQLAESLRESLQHLRA